jgi:hypothetical protein
MWLSGASAMNNIPIPDRGKRPRALFSLNASPWLGFYERLAKGHSILQRKHDKLQILLGNGEQDERHPTESAVHEQEGFPKQEGSAKREFPSSAVAYIIKQPHQSHNNDALSILVANKALVELSPRTSLQVDKSCCRSLSVPLLDFGALLNTTKSYNEIRLPDPEPEEENVNKHIEATSRKPLSRTCSQNLPPLVPSRLKRNVLPPHNPFDRGPPTTVDTKPVKNTWINASPTLLGLPGLTVGPTKPEPWPHLLTPPSISLISEGTPTVSQYHASEGLFTGSFIPVGHLQKASVPFGPPPSVSFPDTPPNINSKSFVPSCIT